MKIKVGRNDFGGQNDTSQKTLSIFNHVGRPAGTCKSHYLNEKELATLHLHVLLNCEEVQPYIE